MKKVTIGIIGAGRIGKIHGENLTRNPNVRVKSISDIQIGPIRAWAERIGIERMTDRYQDILDDAEVDAVFICSPTNTHTAIIAEAARKGKHIFCEKPISFSVESTLEALRVVKETGVKFQTGFNRRFDHNFKRVRELVRDGKVGEPHIIRITSRDPEPPPAEYIKVSGGLFIDMAIHDFDMARYLSGSEVEEVHAFGAVLVDAAIGELGDIDTAVTVLKFRNGAVGVIDNSRKAVYGYDQRVEVFGSGGSVSNRNDFDNSAELMTAHGAYSDKPKHSFLERYQDAYIEETKIFVDCILQDREVPVDGNDGLQAELIAHAAKKSWMEKRAVTLDEILNQVNV